MSVSTSLAKPLQLDIFATLGGYLYISQFQLAMRQNTISNLANSRARLKAKSQVE